MNANSENIVGAHPTPTGMGTAPEEMIKVIAKQQREPIRYRYGGTVKFGGAVVGVAVVTQAIWSLILLATGGGS